MGFVMARGDGELVDIEELWCAVGTLGELGARDVALEFGVLLGIRLADAEATIARALYALVIEHAAGPEERFPAQLAIAVRWLLDTALLDPPGDQPAVKPRGGAHGPDL